MFNIVSSSKTTAFLLLFLFPIADSLAQNINTPENFPDPNFRTVVEEYIGVDPGGEFTAEQVAAVTESFLCVRKEIQDLTGIEYFTNITRLNCSDNALTHFGLME